MIKMKDKFYVSAKFYDEQPELRSDIRRECNHYGYKKQPELVDGCYEFILEESK